MRCLHLSGEDNQTLKNSKILDTKEFNLLDWKHIDTILDIIDVAENNGDSVCTPERELFYEDREYKYYFPVTCYGYAMVKFKNQTEETLQDALKDGKIQIQDLDAYKISYIKEEKS